MLVLTGFIAAPASAATKVESDTRDGNRELHQELNIERGPGAFWTLHYWTAVRDPDGFEPYCVTLRLERKSRRRGWRGLGKGSDRHSRDCFDATSETEAYWDAFVYPRKKLKRNFRRGKVRLHGWTDLGGDITFRY